jgi:hypothetical protein
LQARNTCIHIYPPPPHSIYLASTS